MELILAERLLSGVASSCPDQPTIVVVAPPAAAPTSAATASYLSFSFKLARGLEHRRRAGYMAGPQRRSRPPLSPRPRVVLLAPRYLTAEAWATIPSVRAALDWGLLALGLCGAHGALDLPFGKQPDDSRSSTPLITYRTDAFDGSLPPPPPLSAGSAARPLLAVTVQSSGDASTVSAGPGPSPDASPAPAPTNASPDDATTRPTSASPNDATTRPTNTLTLTLTLPDQPSTRGSDNLA